MLAEKYGVSRSCIYNLWRREREGPKPYIRMADRVALDIDGERKTLREWCNLTGISPRRARLMLERGFPGKVAIGMEQVKG
jgi:predicted DNA-binding transcriptional regulator AlpA